MSREVYHSLFLPPPNARHQWSSGECGQPALACRSTTERGSAGLGACLSSKGSICPTPAGTCCWVGHHPALGPACQAAVCTCWLWAGPRPAGDCRTHRGSLPGLGIAGQPRMSFTDPTSGVKLQASGTVGAFPDQVEGGLCSRNVITGGAIPKHAVSSCCLVAKVCLSLCDPAGCSLPGS